MAVRGDEASPVNKGLLCVKGYHLPAMLYGEDRLTHPMLRDGDSWRQISWDEALDLIAEKFQEALDEKGPDGVAVYGSGQWTVFDGYAALKWVKGGMRSNNLDPNARLCMASAVMGFVTQFQSDEPMGCYKDFEVGDDFILWGNNMAEMHPVLFSRILESKRKRSGVRMVDIATRRTPTSDYADMYVEFRPGSDLALANGILHLLLKNDKIDRPFIKENLVFKRGIEDLEQIGYGCYGEQAERYTFKDKGRDSSLEELERFLRDYTPEKVSEISGVPVAQIHTLAGMYGDSNRGTVSTWCMGVNQHYRGTWMNNLINDLHLITGKISRPGNNPFSLTGQPSACGTAREVGTLSNRLPADMVVMNADHRKKAEEIWGLEPGTINPKPGYHAVDMFRALMRSDVKAIWIQTTNPWVTMPNLHRMDRKPGDGRFVVVSDIYPTPTTERADLVLPSAGWVEREGVFGNSERRTQQWNQLVPPPGEAKEDAWQIMEVARRMGMGHLFPWPEDDWHEAMFEEYRSFTLGIGKDLASYEQLKATRGMLWPVVDGKETRLPLRRRVRSVCEEEEGRPLLQGEGLRREGCVLAAPVSSAGRGARRRVSVLDGDRASAGALAHRLDDPPGQAAASGGSRSLRRAESHRRSGAGGEAGRSGATGQSTGLDGAAGVGRRTRQAAPGFGLRAVLRREPPDQRADAGRDGQHQQGAGLQEVGRSHREGLNHARPCDQDCCRHRLRVGRPRPHGESRRLLGGIPARRRRRGEEPGGRTCFTAGLRRRSAGDPPRELRHGLRELSRRRWRRGAGGRLLAALAP